MPIYQVPTVSAAGLQPKYQKFTSSGTFTLPTGYGAGKPLLVNIQVLGGGGGGGAMDGSTNNFNVRAENNNFHGYKQTVALSTLTIENTSTAGGSGGICASQLYLTENLTITVGAAGTRSVVVPTLASNQVGGQEASFDVSSGANGAGGTGGTTTAGVLQATGGVGGFTSGNVAFGTNNFNGPARNNGSGGLPAGTAVGSNPLLGALAPGTNATTAIQGSYGIGGKRGDATTTLGAEGTGGGGAAVGASGAVILTWWE
jgi:hypothetical protein